MTNVSLERIADTLYPKPEPRNSTAYGTVSAVNADGSYQVRLNASATTTRCAKLCDAEVSDRVLVLIQANGHCAAIGRVGGSIEPVDTIIEQSTDGNWTYRKWSSGIAECWGTHSFSITLNSRQAKTVSLPTGLFTAAPTATVSVGISGTASAQANYTETSSSGLTCYVYSSAGSGTANGWMMVHAFGRWS